MRSKLAISLAFVIVATALSAQKLKTRSGQVRFFSETPIENIEAINNQVSSVINLENGQFAYLVPIKAFVFEKALMQEHFNENYMESGKYPNASFTGISKAFEGLDLSKNQTLEIELKGKMTIHGTEKEISTPVVLEVKDGKLLITSKFNVLASDYNIEIPAAKSDNINNNLEVTVKIGYDK